MMAAKFWAYAAPAGKKHFRPNLTYDPAFDCDRDRTSLVLWLHGPNKMLDEIRADYVLLAKAKE